MSRKGSIAKRHHYVPQGYLTGFANEKEHIHVIPFSTSESRRTPHLRNVGVEKDLYMLYEPPVFESPDEVEHQLGHIDGAAAKIIKKIRDGGWRIGPEERETLSFYLAIQATRGPEVQARQEHFLRALDQRGKTMRGPQDVLDFVNAYREATFPYLDVEEVWKNIQDPSFSFVEDLQLNHVKNMFMSAHDIVRFISCRAWEFVYFDDSELLTSDAAVSPYTDNASLAADRFRIQDAAGILFPISRRIALIMGSLVRGGTMGEGGVINSHMSLVNHVLRGELDRTSRGTPRRSQGFNSLTVNSAYKYIYRHPDDAHLDPHELPASSLLK